MICSLGNFFVSINSKNVSSFWHRFSVKQSDIMEDINYVREEHKGSNLYFTSSGYEPCSVSFSEEEDKSIVEEMAYRFCANVLMTKGILHLHSSFVLYEDKALIFTGPSGIGKTTQAELWRDFQDALIVNGDACLLRQMEDGQWWAFGTPIHGSSPYCENEKAPIAAIITLEQGEENVLTRMDDFSALSYCLPEFYRPKMDEKTEETFWDSVDSLFRSVPVYHLVCRPDREATEIVKKEIFDV